MLRKLPGGTEVYANLEVKDYRQRPNLPINTILAQPQALAIIQEAMEILIAAGASEAAIPPAGDDETPAALTGE